MRRRLAIVVALAALVALGAGPARGELAQTGNVRISFAGDFAPHSLPRQRLAPVTVAVDGSVATTDGSHPPPLRRLEIALNRNGRLSTRGLPGCRSGMLQSTSTETALARCRPALVGRGRFAADVQLDPSQVPVRGTILAFFGRQAGKPRLLLHLHGTVPVVATFVLSLEISRRAQSPFGTVLSARLPRLAGGLGSITDIELEIGREYRHRGKLRSFVSASCGAPAGFRGAVFPFARASFHFAGLPTLRTTLVRSCRVRA